MEDIENLTRVSFDIKHINTSRLKYKLRLLPRNLLLLSTSVDIFDIKRHEGEVLFIFQYHSFSVQMVFSKSNTARMRGISLTLLGYDVMFDNATNYDVIHVYIVTLHCQRPNDD